MHFAVCFLFTSLCLTNCLYILFFCLYITKYLDRVIWLRLKYILHFCNWIFLFSIYLIIINPLFDYTDQFILLNLDHIICFFFQLIHIIPVKTTILLYFSYANYVSLRWPTFRSFILNGVFRNTRNQFYWKVFHHQYYYWEILMRVSRGEVDLWIILQI